MSGWKELFGIATGRKACLAGVLIIISLLSGCGCYIHGDWVDIGDDAEMASLMEESKPSTVLIPASVATGGGFTPEAVTYTPLPDSFIDRLFIYIAEPDEETFDDMFTGPFGFICEFGLVPPEIISPSWDDTVTSDAPTITWTDAEGGYAPYEYWILCDDDLFFGSPEIMVCAGDDVYFTIPDGVYECGSTVYITLLCFDMDGFPAYGEVVMFHYPPCDWTGDESGTIGSGIGETIIGDGGAVRVVEIGQWFSETAVVSLPFSEMFTGLTDDNGNRVGMNFNFGVPRYVLLLPLFVMFFLLFLIGDKKKKKNGKVIKR